MKKLMKNIILMVAMLFGAVAPIEAVSAAGICENGPNAGVYYEGDLPSSCNSAGAGDRMNKFIKSIINTVIGVIGVVAVVMIIYAGFIYAISFGEPNKAKQAQQMIIYSLAGLVVAILAFAIVNFVLEAAFRK